MTAQFIEISIHDGVSHQRVVAVNLIQFIDPPKTHLIGGKRYWMDDNRDYRVTLLDPVEGGDTWEGYATKAELSKAGIPAPAITHYTEEN